MNIIGGGAAGGGSSVAEINTAGIVDTGDGAGGGAEVDVTEFAAVEADMEGLGKEQDISGEYDASLYQDANFSETGYEPTQGTSPNPPEHNPASKGGLAGALVLPPMPPVGTAKGRNPELRFVKPNTRAALAPPQPLVVPPLAVPLKAARATLNTPQDQPKRFAQTVPLRRVRPSGEAAPLSLGVGSFSERGTVVFSRPTTARLPLGTPLPDFNAATQVSKSARRVPAQTSKATASAGRDKENRAGQPGGLVGVGRVVGPKAETGKPTIGKALGKLAHNGAAGQKGAAGQPMSGQPKSGQPAQGQLVGVLLLKAVKAPPVKAQSAPNGDTAQAVRELIARNIKAQEKSTQNTQIVSMLARKILMAKLQQQLTVGKDKQTRRFRNSQGVKDGSKSPLPPTPLPDSDAEIGDGSGLKGEYYLGRNFDQYVFTRADPNVEFFWGADTSPSPRLPVGADWTVRWTGKMEPKFSETYSFFSAADDGVRVWINHKLIIDNWTLHPMTEYSGQIKLEAGKQYAVRVDFFESAGPPAAVWLYWESASQKKEFVPQSQFFYPLAGDDAELDKDELPRK